MKRILIGAFRLTRFTAIFKDFYLPLVVLGILAYGALNSYILIGAIVSLFILLYTFAVNDCEDYEDDAKDAAKKNRNPISAGQISYTEAVWILRILSLITFILSLIVFSFWPVFISMTALLIGHLYSWKVIRFKSIPIIDFISHGYFLAIAEVLYFISLPSAKLNEASYLLAIGAGLISFGGAFYNQYRDFEVDRETNIKNTSSLFKSKKTAFYISMGFYAVGFVVTVFGVIGRGIYLFQ